MDKAKLQIVITATVTSPSGTLNKTLTFDNTSSANKFITDIMFVQMGLADFENSRYNKPEDEPTTLAEVAAPQLLGEEAIAPVAPVYVPELD